MNRSTSNEWRPFLSGVFRGVSRLGVRRARTPLSPVASRDLALPVIPTAERRLGPPHSKALRARFETESTACGQCTRRRFALALAWLAAGMAMVLAASAAPFTEPADGKAWPDGWRVRVPVAVAQPAESLELLLAHEGVVQDDGRDIRVFAPDGRPVSRLVEPVDARQCRIVFDGAAGAGEYAVYFGNLDVALPAEPDGVGRFGRAEWVPAGGYTITSYDAQGADLNRIISLESTVAVTREIAARAEAAEQAEKAKPQDPKRPRAFVVQTVSASGSPRLPPERGWIHRVRAEIQVPVAGKYEIVLDGPAQEYRVLCADGNYAKALVPGWYGVGGQHQGMVSDWMGEAELSAGKHVLELFTNRAQPQIRLGLSGSPLKAMPLTGAQAVYAATRVGAGDWTAANNDLAGAMRACAEAWLAANLHANARRVCRAGQARFAGQPEVAAVFATLGEKTLAVAYARDWLTEGKVPGRTGFVPVADFAPPLQLVGGGVPRQPHDEGWRSSAVISEGTLWYGLPCDVQDTPWGVTSAVCVADGVLYAGTKNGVLHAVNLGSGTLRWSFPAGGACVGCPLLYGGVVYFGSLDQRLYAVDPDQGRMLWNYPVKGWIEGSPCAAGGTVFFGARDGVVYAVDARLGVERWHTAVGAPVVATVVTDETRVFVGTRLGRFVALAAATGAVRWEYAAGAAILGGACVAGNTVSFGDAAGNVHCLNAETGKSAWPKPVAVGGPVVAAPICVGGILYGGTANRRTWGIDLARGFLGWQAAESAGANVGGFGRPAAYAEGLLAFAADADAGRVLQYRMARLPPQPCLQTPVAPAIDGKLEEPAWKADPRWPALYRANGLQDADPVEVKTLWDKSALYLAVTVSGAEVAPDAAVAVSLDPRGDGLAVFEFCVQADGRQTSALRQAVERDPADTGIEAKLAALKLPAEFKPQWKAAVARQAAAWSAEIAIPFDQLPQSATPRAEPNRRWRINVAVSGVPPPVGSTGAADIWGLCPTGAPGSSGAHWRWPDLVFDGKSAAAP